MKLATVLICFTSFFTSGALADECRDRFIELVTEKRNKGAVTINIEQWGKGALTSKNNFYYIGTGQWMTEMLEPENMAWTLVTNSIMYTSADKGKSWKKIRKMDSAGNEDTTVNVLKQSAQTTTGATCGKEALDGVMHDTVEAQYKSKAVNGLVKNKYWVNAETDWITKLYREVNINGSESFTTQIMTSTPDLKLPEPEGN